MQLLSGRDVAEIPSALIGQPAPETNLPPLEGMALPGLDSKNFAGKVTLVNVWASWCAPCREEHPLLLALVAGQAFQHCRAELQGRAGECAALPRQPRQSLFGDRCRQRGPPAIDWGVYGVPETFLVGKDGKILFKHVGPLTEQAVTGALMPEIEKALAASIAASAF